MDLQSNNEHCGTCYNKVSALRAPLTQCAPQAKCEGGKCVCRVSNLTSCGYFSPTCVDLQTDRTNCGVCDFNVC